MTRRSLPDLAVVRGSLRDFLERHPGPDAIGLVVEVADSSLERDRNKRRFYARVSIPIYWILNLVDRQLEVYKRLYQEPSQAVKIGASDSSDSSDLSDLSDLSDSSDTSDTSASGSSATAMGTTVLTPIAHQPVSS